MTDERQFFPADPASCRGFGFYGVAKDGDGSDHGSYERTYAQNRQFIIASRGERVRCFLHDGRRLKDIEHRIAEYILGHVRAVLQHLADRQMHDPRIFSGDLYDQKVRFRNDMRLHPEGCGVHVQFLGDQLPQNAAAEDIAENVRHAGGGRQICEGIRTSLPFGGNDHRGIRHIGFPINEVFIA